MTDEKVRMAETMLKDKENYPAITDIIKDLGIGRTTFYRYFPPERISSLREWIDGASCDIWLLPNTFEPVDYMKYFLKTPTKMEHLFTVKD